MEKGAVAIDTLHRSASRTFGSNVERLLLVGSKDNAPVPRLFLKNASHLFPPTGELCLARGKSLLCSLVTFKIADIPFRKSPRKQAASPEPTAMAPEPKTPAKARGRQSKKQGIDSDDEKQRAAASSARSGRKSARKAHAVPDTPTPKGRKQVKKNNKAYVDDEAQGDDERSSEEEEEEDEEDRAFIDDRDEGELVKSASSDIDDAEPDPIPETPKARTRGSNKNKKAESDEEPVEPVRSKGKKRAKSDEEEEVTARKGNVSVKLLDNKITVKSVPSAVERAKDKAELLSDGDENPFLAKEDDEFPGAADVEDKPSPRKKAKTNTVVDDDDAMEEAETSRDPIQETPVSKISRRMKDSNIGARGAGPSDAGPSGIRYLRADSPESTGAALVDAISNFDDPVHRRYMCRTMYDTYTGPKAPPLIGEAKGLLTCYTNDSTNVLIMFRKAMKYVGIMQDDPRFDFLKKLSVTAVFGRYLFNLARVDSADFVKNVVRSGNYQNTVYRCLRNLSRSPDYNDKDYVGFTLYGTIIESQLTKSFIVKTRDGRNYHLRHAIIRPLSMEIQRAMNGIATMLGAEAIGMPIRTGGIQLSTTLSPNPYPDAPKGARDSSEEPDLSLPAYSVGGRTVHRETDEADRRAEIKNAVATGIRFTNDHLPVYDLRAAVRKGNYPGCNQETLGAAEPWREGEIPENSYVCAHYVPGSRPHKDTKHEDVSFQLMRIVVLATPDRD
ncbi:hypothetical protein BC629DRAFT_1598215 [Irpex lacteus]|nr:hypothetical protein BC629DRAFT_1598215 [Irpex lacteus]